MIKFLRNVFVIAGLCSSLWPAVRAQSANLAPVITVAHGPNAAAQQSKHYVVLVSLDGFRYDYAAKFGAPNLERLAAEGASAPEGMIPSFPSITFPNHYTIVTGWYPEHHGIIANNFYDPARKQNYASRNADTVRDGSWYGGVPLWSLAEKQGMRAACLFWPGSEAEIAGERPSYYLHYDNAVPDEQRIDQVIAWLKLPAVERPHFITLYYYEPDHTGHSAGPESPQTGDAVHHVDALMGTLMADLKALHLAVDLIVLADHGMATVEGDWIDLDHYADLSKFVTNGSLLYAPDEKAAERAYQQLRGASDKFVVYRRRDVPAYLHFNTNARIGDPVVIPTGPYLIRAHAPDKPEASPTDGGQASPTGGGQAPPKGEHGYDPSKMKSMRAIFYAEGPDIRMGYVVKPFANIDVYPLIARILGLRVGRIDGTLEPVRGMLRGAGAVPAGNTSVAKAGR